MAKQAEMTREEYLATELASLHVEIQEAAERGSWQAVINGRRLAGQWHAELVALRAESTPGEISSIDDVVSELLTLPDAVFSDPRVQERVRKCC